jgi:galactokinase/mevalonate kinase-like predicted kinase
MSTLARPEPARVVEATAPCRVDLAGGVLAGFPEALRPATAFSIAVALDRRAYCRVSRISSGVQVESKDTLLKLQVPSVADLPTEGVAGLARSVLLAMGIESGLEVITQARVPFEAGLGSGEFRQGRSMDALLSAYRMGARVTFREMSKV